MLCYNAEYHYAQFYWAKCRILFTIMLNGVMLSVGMLNVVAPEKNWMKKTELFIKSFEILMFL
jgi:hypothetical protein